MLFVYFIILSFSLFTSLLEAGTAPSHVIGTYILSAEASKMADSSDCPTNMTVSYFNFAVSSAPSLVIDPKKFNFKINHESTSLEGNHCNSFNAIQALGSDHPFAENATAILDAWGKTGGLAKEAVWTETLITSVAKQSWVVGYDFTERFCEGIILEGGIGYLWHQSAWQYLIGDGFVVQGGVDYLFLTFRSSAAKGCVYEGDNILGEGGPTSDPSNPGDGTPPDVQDTPVTGGTDSLPLNPTQPSTTAPETGSVAVEDGDGEANTDEPSDSFGSAAAESGNDDGESACFPASTKVVLENGKEREMRGLEIGERVKTKDGGHSDVFFFSHREMDGVYHFVRVETDAGKVVVLSQGHYMHVQNGLVAAGSVKIGDHVLVLGGMTEKVVGVALVEGVGRFAPHTFSGDVVVDGIVVSSYTTAVHPVLAHYVLLLPVRMLYRVGLQGWLEGWLDGGKGWLRQLLPRGPHFLGRVV